jgi:hypothetical protein
MVRLWCLPVLLLCAAGMTMAVSAQEVITAATRATLEQKLVANYGEGERERLHRGLDQVARLWRAEDGDAAAYAEFVRTQFAANGSILDSMFSRFERLHEALDGHMTAIAREFRMQADLDLGPVLPFDEVFAGYDPSAHVADDFFANKLAFTVLLNFPLTTLDQRLNEGTRWTRRQWAEARLAQRFGKRIPASVNLAVARAAAESDRYIAEYNIWMHHLLDKTGKRPFPEGMRLLSHWNLRDQIKADYQGGAAGLGRQRLIQGVMEHIVLQTIPAAVINNPYVDWNPLTNAVTASSVNDGDVPAKKGIAASSAAEPDTRYAVLLNTFLASKQVDPYSPAAPTLIARRFDENREIPEARFKAMLEQVVSAPAIERVARLVASRLGRSLEPFDIWYNGFRPKGGYTEEQLDKIVAAKYPDAAAFERDIPEILTKLGFARNDAQFLADHIQVDAARGSGHAMGAAMRADKVHLRTRIEKGGMNYKGFNIAVHELGHNVEQVISLHRVDHTLLQGVPNTAFTEAIAFVFQAQDLDLLGLRKPDPQAEALKTLNDFWAVYEIAGVALVDMGVWHWMYDHPAATPAQLKEATLDIARSMWNRYYAPVLGKKDVVLLGIYSHMIHSFLYLPDYPLGHLIAHQVEEHIRKSGTIASEVERMTRYGSVAPDLWMQHAVGTPVGADAMIHAAERALEVIR